MADNMVMDEPQVDKSAEETENPATETIAGDAEVSGEATPSGQEDNTDLEKIAKEIDQEGWVGEEGLEHLEGEQLEGEHLEKEQGQKKKETEVMGEGEELLGEHEGDEELEGEAKEEKVEEEQVGEEIEEEQEPPVDPSAPYDFSDSKEALKAPFELRPDQLAEVEQLWEIYQQPTPAYTDINGYVTEVELVYLLKCLLLMTYTPEQMQELIMYCVRPPHPDGHIIFDQFVKMVTLRQRDFPIEEELRQSLLVMDPDNTGLIDRTYLREVLAKQGYKMPAKHLDNFIKEVDMSNDGTIGIEDVVGTLCIDLNRDDIVMLMNTLNPPGEQNDKIDDLL